jgi:DNA-3-methyladenine glycosylase
MSTILRYYRPMSSETPFRWETLPGVQPIEPVGNALVLTDAVSLARELLGTLVARRVTGGWCVARIVETEAYRQDDPASHSFRGQTKRTSVMFGPPGISYVYLIYGMYNCLNVVCEPAGVGAAVLIRAVEPIWGVENLWGQRFPKTELPANRERLTAKERKVFYNLTSGPGKLCRALALTKERHNGLDLSALDGELVLGRWRDDYAGPRGKVQDEGIVTGPRIGIREGVEQPWRFGLAGNPFVSPYPFSAASKA